MKKTLNILLVILASNCFAKEGSLIQNVVNEPVRNFADTIDLSSPHRSYISFMHLVAKGKVAKYREVKSETMLGYLPASDVQDVTVDEAERQAILSTIICSYYIFDNCVGAVVTRTSGRYVIGWSQFEKDHWLNLGESTAKDSAEVAQNIARVAPLLLASQSKFLQLEKVSKDTALFVNYLAINGKSPKDYLLEKLRQNKLVIYGEVHKRRKSWDVLIETVRDTMFAKQTRTIYMELPSNAQNRLNSFMSGETLDSAILISVLQDEQIYGWEDKGMFHFLCNIWEIDKKLPLGSKIRLIAADYQMPFFEITSADDLEKANKARVNRDENMSNVIMANLDQYSALFVVGVGHARKFSTKKEKPRAATILKARLGKQVFCVFSHSAIIDNNGNIFGNIRNGLFDAVFALNNNCPVGFDLQGSPFGRELFDAHNEIRFDYHCGRFEDVYDGYLFLEPSNSIEGDYLLFELFSDEFVTELKRRALIFSLKDGWYTIPHAELTKERIWELLYQSKSVN